MASHIGFIKTLNGMAEVSTEENRHVGIFCLKGIVPNMTDKGVTSDLFLFKDLRKSTRSSDADRPDISSVLAKILPLIKRIRYTQMSLRNFHSWETFLNGISLLKAYLSPLLSSLYLCYCFYMSSLGLHDVFTDLKLNFLKIWRFFCSSQVLFSEVLLFFNQ